MVLFMVNIDVSNHSVNKQYKTMFAFHLFVQLYKLPYMCIIIIHMYGRLLYLGYECTVEMTACRLNEWA